MTDLSSRHSVLTKQKIFKDKPKLQSNSGKLTGWLTTGTSDHPVVVNDNATTITLREEDEDEVINLDDIPEAPSDATSEGRKRRRRNLRNDAPSSASENDSDESIAFSTAPPSKRNRTTHHEVADDESDGETLEPEDDKKKLGINTSYDGFSIYGRILCLVVKRTGTRNKAGSAPSSSQRMLENWVSTQAAAEQVDDNDD